eukprot:10110857-Lingulodinium_polyedra.AAC.1
MEATWGQHGGHVAMCRYFAYRLRAANTCILVYPPPVGSVRGPCGPAPCLIDYLYLNCLYND